MKGKEPARDEGPPPLPAPSTRPKPAVKPKPNVKTPSPAALAAATASSSAAAAAAAARKRPPTVKPKPNAAHQAANTAAPGPSSRQLPPVNLKPQIRPQQERSHRPSSSGRSNAAMRSSMDAGSSVSGEVSAATSSREPPVVNPKPQRRLQKDPVSRPSSSGRASTQPQLSADAAPSSSSSASASASANRPPSVSPRKLVRRQSQSISRQNTGTINQPAGSSPGAGPSVAVTTPSTSMPTAYATQPMPVPRPRPVSRPIPPAHVLNQRTPNGLTVDSLANAMVAGNLATRAASERSSQDLLRPSSTIGPGAANLRPPAPPPARRSGTTIPSMFNSITRSGPSTPGRLTPQSTGEQGRRRMKDTLRKPRTGSDEEREDEKKRSVKKILGKKHPNKHHEGDRRRWRDEVTEKERNRYEGVWASNKGLHAGVPVQRPSPAQLPSMGSSPNEQLCPARRVEERLSPFSGIGSGEQQQLGYHHQNASTQSFATDMSSPASQASSANNSPFGSLPRPSPVSSTHNHAERFSRMPTIGYTPPPSDCVSSLVVRDIWSRSRLSPEILSEIWELVDRTGTGMLCCSEFCAGMWLIDQRLKGRKLPQRVGREVWHSLEGLKGVKKRFK